MHTCTHTIQACGASIDEMNTIRKHLSAISGGRLASAAYPATMLTLVLSDVVGDPLSVIASGPTVPDDPLSTFGECRRIVDHYGIRGSLPPAVVACLESGESETRT